MNISQFNFGAGEINPRMENRLDTDVAKIGLYKAENVIITPQGSAIRRPGLEYLSELSGAFYILPFVYNGTDYLMVFYYDGQTKIGVATTSGSIIHNATFGLSGQDLGSVISSCSFAQGNNEIYMASMHYPLQRISYNGTAVTIASVNTAAWSGGQKPKNAGMVYNQWQQDSPVRYPTAVTVWRGRLWFSGQSSRPAALGASMIAGKGLNYAEKLDAPGFTDTASGPGQQPTEVTRDFTHWDATSFVPIYGSYDTTVKTNMRIREGVSEVNALDYNIGSAMGRTQWLIGQKILYQGTDAMELIFQESADGRTNPDPITQPMVKYDPHSQRGSTSPIVVMTADGPLHINGDQVRMIVYSTEKQAYNSVPMSDHSNLKGPFRQAASATIPYPITWFLTESGDLWAFTLEQKNGVAAWTKQTTWNPDRVWDSVNKVWAGPTKATIKSIAIVRSGTTETLYALVQRTINGVSKTFLEKMRLFDYTSQNDAACLDSMKSGTSSLNMGHLTGAVEQLTVMVDGATGDPATASGSMSWPGATKVHAGIPYTSVMVTTKRRVDVDGQQVDDKRIKVSRALIMVEKTLGLKVGPDTIDAELEQGVSPDNRMDQPTPWLSGELESFLNGPQGAERIRIESTGPLPYEVLGVTVVANAG